MNTVHAHSPHRLPHRQHGVALIVALIILAGVTLISLAGVGQSSMELRMARNLDTSGNAFQTAEALVDLILQNADDTLPTAGPVLVPIDAVVGDTSVGAAGLAGGILPNETTANTVFYSSGGESITAQTVRLLDCAPPPRSRTGSSITAFSAFAYEVIADVDRNVTGNGRAGIAQGYQTLGPKC